SHASAKEIQRQIARDQGSDANTTSSPAPPPKQGSPSMWLLMLARLCLRITRFERWQIWPRCAIWCQGRRETGTRRFADARLRLTQKVTSRIEIPQCSGLLPSRVCYRKVTAQEGVPQGFA